VKTLPSIYDTPELGEVKQILGPRIGFFPDFALGWHTSRVFVLLPTTGILQHAPAITRTQHVTYCRVM
jgi:hypothetical protein